MKQPSIRLQPVRHVCAGATLVLSAALCALPAAAGSLEALPADPEAGRNVPDGVTEITQTREQNAVTSVRVRRGGNVYHVTPPEQIPESQSGVRAAQWEIFQFRGRSVQDSRDVPPPPPR